MELHLNGKLALVTASTGGIGKAVATSLAGEGVTVIVNGRTDATVDAAIDDVRSRVPGAELERLVADNGTAAGTTETLRRFPAVDVLVNNLGIFEAVDFFDATDEDWQRLFEVNVLSGVRLARGYLPTMLANQAGRVLFIASEAAALPTPEMVHYSATKTMLLSVSRNLAELTRGTRVTVNAVMAGSTRTEGTARFVQDLFPGLPFGEAEERFMREYRATSLLQHLIDPAEIGDFVAYAASPRAAAVNGAALRIEGGLVPTVL